MAAARYIRRALGRLRRDERGFTIVEGAVAGLLLVAGALGALQIFDASTRNNFRAEQSQVVVNRLQAELEQVKALPYPALAMTSSPAPSTDPYDPRSLVSGGTVSVGGVARDMVVNGGALPGGGTITEGAVNPGPTPFTSGDISGKIYRFVAWMPDPGCPSCGNRSMKRIIVAATIDNAPISFQRNFQLLQTDVSDPERQPTNNPPPPCQGSGCNPNAVASFWLTDTPCIFTNRQQIEVISPTDGHPTHNTRGACSAGKQTGNTAGAPDLMFTEAPALDPNYPPIAQPLYDYATDVEPVSGTDKGLLLREPSTNGCLLSGSLLDLPLLESSKHQKLHKWVSREIPSGFNISLLGDATLNLYTRSINGASYQGKICVHLFTRELNLLGIPVDTPIVNTGPVNPATGVTCPLGLTYCTLQLNPWPTGWTRVRVPFQFASTQLLPNRRLGLAITLEASGTQGAEGMEFMYDHPAYPSRLEVHTSALLPW